MASLGTYGDSLRVCWTGVRGGDHAYDPAHSLGGERLGETVHVKAIIDDPIPSLRIRGFSATTSTGTGYLSASVIGGVMYASYSAPGDDYGPAATLSNGDTVLLVSDNEADTVRVERVSSNDNGGVMTLTVVEQTNGALGMESPDSADMITGGSGLDSYRALMLHNASDAAISDVVVYVKPLVPTGVVTDSTQLSASGGGYINSSTPDAFADWPNWGWARVETAAGVLRENVFYTSSGTSGIRVLSAGRALLGTSAAAGASDDVVYAIPGIEIAKEAPSSGAIQTVVDANTAPSGLTWNTEIDATGGLTEATLAADGELGLWLHREIPDSDSLLGFGIGAQDASQWNRIVIGWTCDGNEYLAELAESYSSEVHSSTIYYMYIGEDAAPDLDDLLLVTHTSLPFYETITPPVSGQADFNITVRALSKHGLFSRNVFYRTITVDSAGDQVLSSHTAPVDVAVSDTAGGHVLIRASYYDDEDATAADTFRIYISTDGDDPDTGTDTPVEVAMVRTNYMRPGYHLRYETPSSYPYSTDFRVLVTSYNSDDTTESNNATATTHTVGTDTQPNWDSKAWTFIGGNRRHYEAPDDTVSETETTDATNGVSVEVGVGWAEFYAGSALVWKVFYDSLRPDKTAMYIPSDWALINATYAGAGSDDLIETGAWNGDKHLYIPVGLTGSKTRRVFIDVDAKQLRCADFDTHATLPDVNPEVPIASYPAHTVFEVYDAATHRWVPYLSVNDADNGEFHTSIAIDMSLSQAQIEAL